jgi:hypothetical protein
MKYYELFDEVNIPGRWHLGEVFNRIDGSTLELWSGLRMNKPVSLDAEITHAGKPLDFFLTSFANPIARKPLAEALAAIAGNDLQVLPVNIAGYKDFEILNILRVIRCLDEKKSKFSKWTKDSFRPDKAGQYEWVTNLTVDPSQISPSAHIFRIEGWKITVVVSEQTKALMERCGCFGAKFELVS